MSEATAPGPVARRFRGFMPVAVDVESGGFNPETDALLELAAIILNVDGNGRWYIEDSINRHIQPFEGANLDPAALEFTGIDPEHPFRRQIAVSERTGLTDVFRLVRQKVRQHGCKRAILVGHNPAFDLSFLNAVVARTGIKRNPFHPFSSFDTATLGGVAYGQTVLSRAVQAAGLDWDSSEAHSALYDAERTAELFCSVVNRWDNPPG